MLELLRPFRPTRRQNSAYPRRKRVAMTPRLENLEGRALLASFQGLVALDSSQTSSRATGVSGDGQVVIGVIESKTSPTQAPEDIPVRWKEGEIFPLLGPDGDFVEGSPADASRDGTVIVGQAGYAFRWTEQTGVTALAGIGTDEGSSATGVSSDGKVVVGSMPGDSDPTVAFRWADGTPEILDIREGYSYTTASATDVSGDGEVVTGTVIYTTIFGSLTYDTYRWENSNYELLAGLSRSSPAAISPDGSTIVGVGRRPLQNKDVGYIISDQNGYQEIPPQIGGYNLAIPSDVSENGGVVVGQLSGDGVDSKAFILFQGGMVQDLRETLVGQFGLGDALAGWELRRATGISADGEVIVGNGRFNGEERAWIARLDGNQPSIDIEMLTAMQVDERTVGFVYNVNERIEKLKISLYHSADTEFNHDEDMLIEGKDFFDVEPGDHTELLELKSPLPYDPSRPYLLVVADPTSDAHPERGEISESDETNNSAVIERSGIIWTNRGDDGFEVYDTKFGVGTAELARSIVDWAIADWNSVIKDFKYSNNGFFDIKFRIVDENNLLGRTDIDKISYDTSGKPNEATIELDNDGVTTRKRGWHFGLSDDSGFDVKRTPYTAVSRILEEQNRTDFYSVALHEIGHAVGFIFNASFNKYLDGIESDPNNFLYEVYRFESNKLSAGVTGRGPGLHLYEGAEFPEEEVGGFARHPHDLMTPLLNPGTRARISDLDAEILAEVYGYDIELPSKLEWHFPTGPIEVRSHYGTGDDRIIVEGLPNGDIETFVNGVALVWGKDQFSDVYVQGESGADDIRIITRSSEWTGNLVIRGGSGRDTVKLLHIEAAGDVRVDGDEDHDNITMFSIGSVKNLLADGGAGRDIIDAATLTLPVMIMGGPGRDYLRAGSGNDVLVGGDDGDVIRGGEGDDLIIGGDGFDFLYGDGGDDLIIAGRTCYDANEVALAAIRDEWASPRSYRERISNLRSGAGPILGGRYLLQLGVTVFAESPMFVINVLFGGMGKDWYFAFGLFDLVRDREPGEELN